MACILAAIRSGKSMLAAAKAIHASQTCSVEGLAPGDILRIPILATTTKTAKQSYFHVVGTLQAKPHLKALIAAPPTAESVFVKHPSGRLVEITITALSARGSNLVSTYIATAIFDEAPRMSGDDESKRNLDEALSAIAGRIRPGGQILLIGSPYQPYGPVYDLVQERFGKPGEDCLVVRAGGPAMNPTRWTHAECEALRRRNPDAYKTDVLAEFADPEEALIKDYLLQRAMRDTPVERAPDKGHYYVAAMDPGARASVWTFVIVGRFKAPDGSLRPHFQVVVAKQWDPKKFADGKLNPKLILQEIRTLCDRYGVPDVHTDQFAADALQSLAWDQGVTLITHNVDAAFRLEWATAIKTGLEEDTLKLPPVPELREDLVRLKKRVTSNGVVIQMPVSGAGRHCDFAPALGLALLYPPEAPDLEPEQQQDDFDFEEFIKSRQAENPFDGALERLVT